MKLEVYECSHCAGIVKPNAERCSYCGYYFKKPAPEDAWSPVIVDTIPPLQKYIPEPPHFADVVESKFFLVYKDWKVPFNVMEYSVSSTPMTFHSMLRFNVGVVMGPQTYKLGLSMLGTSKEMNILRYIHNENDYFDVHTGGGHNVFKRCKIETMVARYDQREGLERYLIDLSIRPCEVSVEL